MDDRYKVRLKGRASRFILSQLPRIRNLLIKQLDELAQNPIPPNNKPLDSKMGIYRVRCEKYYFLYQIQTHKFLILVAAIGSRGDIKRFYKEIMGIINKK